MAGIKYKRNRQRNFYCCVHTPLLSVSLIISYQCNHILRSRNFSNKMSSPMVKKLAAIQPFADTVSTFVEQTTTHGIRKITGSRKRAHRMFWIVVFCSSFAVCCYHCSHLISLYIAAPKVTITEEKDAETMEFPALTICNLNVIKRSYAELYFERASKKSKKQKNNTGCFQKEEELLFRSAVDLSDTWLNLGITRDNLSQYGHRAEDLIVQCTYNYKDCFANNTSYKIIIKNLTSPIFGLCHTLNVQDRNKKPVHVKKAGVTLGLMLTLNIEKEDYWDLISPEYGVRLLIHPQNTYPTLQRGGFVVGPGTSVHLGIKRKVRIRLPGLRLSCMSHFEETGLSDNLQNLGLSLSLEKEKYTYEHCNALCQNLILLEECGCVDALPVDKYDRKSAKYCDPCNKTQANCRTLVLRNFSSNGSECEERCKPSCFSVRYDVSLSESDWPNVRHELYIMKRSPWQWENVQQISGVNSLFSSEEETSINTSYFRENLLRVHMYITEMGYMSVEEEYSYKLPKLLADLGGCLGLYLGVSVISIIELLEFFGSIWIVFFIKTKTPGKSRSVFKSRRKKRHKNKPTNDPSYEYPFSQKPYYNERNNFNGNQKPLPYTQDSKWSKTPLTFSDSTYYGYDRPPGRNGFVRQY